MPGQTNIIRFNGQEQSSPGAIEYPTNVGITVVSATHDPNGLWMDLGIQTASNAQASARAFRFNAEGWWTWDSGPPLDEFFPPVPSEFFNVYVADRTPQITGVSLSQPRYPGGSATLTASGQWFGPSQGTLNVCSTSSGLCAQSSDIVRSYGPWNDTQVTVSTIGIWSVLRTDHLVRVVRLGIPSPAGEPR